MKAALRRFSANTVFVAHLAYGAIILTGWAFPRYRESYLFLFAAWPLSWTVLGYCPFTKLEFALRQPDNPALGLETEFVQYYAKRLFALDIPIEAVYRWGSVVFFTLLALTFAV